MTMLSLVGKVAFASRHCEPTDPREVARSDDRLREAIQVRRFRLDCFVASLLAMTILLSAAPSAQAQDAALIEAAKKEGQVVWYTTLIVNQIIRPLKAAFEKKYPGVTLQFTRADDVPTAEKMIAEGRAGRVQADIFDGIINMVPLQAAGLLSPFSVPDDGRLSGGDEGQGRLLARRDHVCVHARHQHHAGAEGTGAEDVRRICSIRS